MYSFKVHDFSESAKCCHKNIYMKCVFAQAKVMKPDQLPVLATNMVNGTISIVKRELQLDGFSNMRVQMRIIETAIAIALEW